MSVVVRPTRVTVRGGRAVRVTVDRTTAARVAAGVGPRGPAGAQGPSGSDAEVNQPAGTPINAGRAVRLDGGQIFLPSLADPSHAEQIVGIAETAASAGDAVRVRAAGQTVNPDWSWAIGPVWVGADGVLTQNPPATGWLLVVGRALGPTTLLVDIEPPTYRS